MDFTTILARIGMAVVTGFVLGLERESHGRAAGLRTTMLVCVAATIAAILSDQLYTESFMGEHKSANWHPDPARLGAGILTGIGFLGAGAILKQGTMVRGVTTASQIWLVTVLGLCYGTGHLALGLIGTAISFVTVFFLEFAEAKMKRDWYATLGVTVSREGISAQEMIALLKGAGMTVEKIEWEEDAVAKTRCTKFLVRFRQKQEAECPDELFKQVLALPGVLRVEWK